MGVPAALRTRPASAPGANRSDLLRAFAPAAATALAFLVFGLLGGWILAGRMLAPHTDRRRGTDGLERIAVPPDPHGRPQDEFRELADVFDTMLVQLESHVTEQQRFTANASHELRTLAISQTLLDVARNDPTRDQGELIERLHTVRTRAIDLTEALLLLSRGDRRASPASPSTSPSSPKKPPKRCFPSPNSAGSRSTSPARQHRPSAPRRSYCGW